MNINFLGNEHICILALWARDNVSDCRTDQLKNIEATKFVFDLFVENHHSTMVDRELISFDWYQYVMVPMVDYKKVEEAEYHKKLMPIEILNMSACASDFCKKSPDFNGSRLDKQLMLINLLAWELSERSEWQEIESILDSELVKWMFLPHKKEINDRDVLSQYETNKENILLSLAQARVECRDEGEGNQFTIL